MSGLLSVDAYVAGLREGNRATLARAITLVESELPAHGERARDLLQAILPATGGAVRIGLSGVPGVGKSTFLDAFGMLLVERGHKVAVLAIDPSSTVTGGSILGDKTRMARLSRDPRAYIRPSPSGGTLGGVARKTREAMLLCEAAGYDVVLVETVGVGQSETVVAEMSDLFLVLMLAGAGDDLQGIKRGILEVADVLAIHKADGDNKLRAESARHELQSALHVMRGAGRVPSVTCVSSLEGTGHVELYEAIFTRIDEMKRDGELVRKRRDQGVSWLHALLTERLVRRFHTHPAVAAQFGPMEAAVREGSCHATVAAERLLALVAG